MAAGCTAAEGGVESAALGSTKVDRKRSRPSGQGPAGCAVAGGVESAALGPPGVEPGSTDIEKVFNVS